MSKSRVWILALVVGICVCSWAGNAGAWEFKMNGEFVYNYQNFSQAGNNGFFGKYDYDAGSGLVVMGLPGDLAPYNFWAGVHRRAGIVSGSDAGWQTYWMDSNMEIRINPALRIRGLYRIGEWAQSSVAAANNPTAAADLGLGDLVKSEYLEYRWSGVQRSMSPGYWNYLFMTAQLPWGIVNFGKRPSAFGTGLGWAGDNRASETASVSALYGPWNFTLGVYPTRRGNNAYYNRDRDKNNTRVYDFGPSIAYRSGALDIGFTMEWGPNHHSGGEGVIGQLRRLHPDTSGINNAPMYMDNHAGTYGGVYFKYNNGRFFANAEVDWDNATIKHRGDPTITAGRGAGAPFVIGRGNLPIRDTCSEHWRFAGELGTYCGPAKLSGLFAWLSGGDRRGDEAGNVGQIDRNGILRSAVFANTTFFRPYSYLINEVYGTGVFYNPDTTDGYMEDAVVWAARLDYAIAANLNCALSFMWADRASASGFGWGCIRPETLLTVGGNPATAAHYMGQVNHNAVFENYNNLNQPNIPDTNLGYEIDGAVDWKLIEGMVLKTTLAYWQPGKWFNWACIDKGVPGWNSRVPVNEPRVEAPPANMDPAFYGVNPNRAIDPIWGLEVKVVGEF